MKFFATKTSFRQMSIGIKMDFSQTFLRILLKNKKRGDFEFCFYTPSL